MTFDIQRLIWLVPLWLLIVLVFQVMYVLFVRLWPTRSETPPPAQPIMPAIYARDPAIEPQPGAPPPQPMMPAGYPPPPMMPAQYAPQQPQPMMPAQYAPPAPVPQPVMAQPTPYPAAPRPTGASGIGKFVVLSGLESQKELPFPASSFGIGRFYSPENGVLIALDEKSISRKHAAVMADEAVREYYIKDTNSSFGTSLMINGVFEPLPPEKQERLYNEDVIQFGNVVTVRVILPTETRSTMTVL